jgi:chemotaxis protein CheY-P-specific phosphatase CheC
MSIWKKSTATFQSLTEISEGDLIILANKMSREDIIEWLSWNDPNGIYHDEQSLKELGNIMSLEEAKEILLRQVEENRVTI